LGKSPQHLVDMRLVEPEVNLGTVEKAKNVCTLLGIEAWLPGYEVLSFVTIPTTLHTNSHTNVSMY
jgi:hypothetical protein